MKNILKYGLFILIVASMLFAVGCQPKATTEAPAADTGGDEATTDEKPTDAPEATEAPKPTDKPADTGGETTAAATCEEKWEAGMPFCESPMMAAKVEAGELPPVEDRLPEDPAVGNARIPWATMERGVYGGTMRLLDYDAGSIGHDGGWAENEPWMETAGLTHSAATMTGGIFASLDILEGDSVFVFHMRKGMKFSNGADFTSEDVAFWWNDMMLNETLTASIGSNFRTGHKPDGNVGVFEVVDDYTFKFTFDGAYGGWAGLFTYGNGLAVFTDSDYLKQIHVDYADPDELEAKIADQGYEPGEWYRLWGYYQSIPQMDKTGYPIYGPWVLTNMTDTMATMERNPYYFKVDDWVSRCLTLTP